MKLISRIALTAAVVLSAFGTITYTSCNKDECKDVVCANSGTCNSEDGSCTCATGFEGTTCETLSRDKFKGTYIGTEACTVGTDNYTVVITEHSEKIKLTLTNLYGQGFTAICTMTGTSTFTFDGSSGNTNYNGNGSLNGNQLTVTYQISNPVSVPPNNSCTFTGSK